MKLQGSHVTVYSPHTSIPSVTLKGNTHFLTSRKKAQYEDITHQLHHTKGCLKTVSI